MYVKLSQNNVKQSDNNISTLATPTDQRTVIFLYSVLQRLHVYQFIGTKELNVYADITLKYFSCTKSLLSLVKIYIKCRSSSLFLHLPASRHLLDL